MNLLDLPDCMIEQIFEYLTYDEIARKRLVCRRVDKICQHLLNIGFSKLIKRHSKDLKRIKSLLPRRESERRNHPLSRHADILTCIETRISMLSMTYSKYMELNLCCFIPGKVIDEIFRILHLVETTTKPLRAHEVLQELRDISSMAIEHFDEKIAHLLKKYFVKLSSQKRPVGIGSVSFEEGFIGVMGQSSSNSSNSLVNFVRRNNVAVSAIKCPENRSNRLMIQRLEQKYTNSMKKLHNHLSLQFNRMIQIQNKQTKQLRENAVLMSEMNSQIAELKRRVEEADAKYREIMANISQITGEPNPGGSVGGGGGGGVGVVVNKKVVNVVTNQINPSIPDVNNCNSSNSSNITHSSDRTIRNIKPRTASVMLKRRITESSSSSPSSSHSSPSTTKTVSNHEINNSDISSKDIEKKSKLDSS